MYDTLRNQWNQIAATEYTGRYDMILGMQKIMPKGSLHSSRIGYQYFGAQASGAYAEWPEVRVHRPTITTLC